MNWHHNLQVTFVCDSFKVYFAQFFLSIFCEYLQSSSQNDFQTTNSKNKIQPTFKWLIAGDSYELRNVYPGDSEYLEPCTRSDLITTYN